MSRKDMLERGRRGPNPTIFSRIQVGVIGGPTSKGAGPSALLHDRLVANRNPMGLVGASDSDRLTPLLTVNAYRQLGAVGVILTSAPK